MGILLRIALPLLTALPLLLPAQPRPVSIREMRWGADFQLHVRLSNDSNYVMDVRALHHSAHATPDADNPSTTYYPVALDRDFVSYIKQREIQRLDSVPADTLAPQRPKTLWSALHRSLAGGYIHFINCIIYSLEAQLLNLSDPIMLRPVTDWRPRPMTPTYRRTRHWAHFIPWDQQLAQREYRRRKREGDLRDLHGIPESFINLFLTTNQRQYEAMRAVGKRHLVAQIDLVRLMLGAKYLGHDQIQFIQSRVLSAVASYSVSNLPSVIVFEDFNAAVAMTLDHKGYRIDYVVYQDQDTLTPEEQRARLEKIEALIDAINDANDAVFRRRLSSYYGI